KFIENLGIDRTSTSAFNGNDERAIPSRPEAFHHQVIRLARHPVFRVITRICECQMHGEQRQCQSNQDDKRNPTCPPRMPLDYSTPAPPKGLAQRLIRALGEMRNAEPIDSAPNESEKSR